MFACGVTALSVAVGLLVAALANQKIRGLAALPHGAALAVRHRPAVAGIIFLFIFHPAYGILPYCLSFVTSYEFNWLLKGWVAMTLVIVATAWTHVGYNIAFFLAGLQAIPTSVMEAASVDGAGPVRNFRSIIVPAASRPSPSTWSSSTWSSSFFGSFGVIHAVTQGGPGNATDIMVFKLWKDGFIGLNLGSSAAQSVILMARGDRR